MRLDFKTRFILSPDTVVWLLKRGQRRHPDSILPQEVRNAINDEMLDVVMTAKGNELRGVDSIEHAPAGDPNPITHICVDLRSRSQIDFEVARPGAGALPHVLVITCRSCGHYDYVSDIAFEVSGWIDDHCEDQHPDPHPDQEPDGPDGEPGLPDDDHGLQPEAEADDAGDQGSA